MLHSGIRTRGGTWTHREAAGAQDRETGVAGERGDGEEHRRMAELPEL